MDVNIGAALWMAAQAEGKLTIIKGSTALTPDSATPSHADAARNDLQQQQGRPVPLRGGQPQTTLGSSSLASFEQEAEEKGGPVQQRDSVAAASGSNQAHARPGGQCTGLPKQQAGPEQQQPRLAQHANIEGVQSGWYRSAAKVVLLGHGADEQHAGYGRHRTSFRNQVYGCAFHLISASFSHHIQMLKLKVQI